MPREQLTESAATPKPCPFCGSRRLYLMTYLILCLDCGATGPDADDMEAALAAWNRRAEEGE